MDCSAVQWRTKGSGQPWLANLPYPLASDTCLQGGIAVRQRQQTAFSAPVAPPEEERRGPKSAGLAGERRTSQYPYQTARRAPYLVTGFHGSPSPRERWQLGTLPDAEDAPPQAWLGFRGGKPDDPGCLRQSGKGGFAAATDSTRRRGSARLSGWQKTHRRAAVQVSQHTTRLLGTSRKTYHPDTRRLGFPRRPRSLSAQSARRLEEFRHVSVDPVSQTGTLLLRPRSDAHVWFSEKISAMCSLSQSISFRAENANSSISDWAMFSADCLSSAIQAADPTWRRGPPRIAIFAARSGRAKKR
jgi:hypothetical protein